MVDRSRRVAPAATAVRGPSRAERVRHTIEGSPEPDGVGRSEVGVEAEQQAEQEFVDMAYARLDAMRSDANAMLEGVLDLGRGGTFQSRTERDVIVRTSLARLEQLDIGDQALTFGRIDRVLDGANGRRRAVRGPTASESGHRDLPHRPAGHPQRRPRAPGGRLAGPGRRAVLPGHRRDPQGLVLRRHLALRAGGWWASRTSGSPAPGSVGPAPRRSRPERRRVRRPRDGGRADRRRPAHRWARPPCWPRWTGPGRVG